MKKCVVLEYFTHNGGKKCSRPERFEMQEAGCACGTLKIDAALG